jgi:hypothetical protein
MSLIPPALEPSTSYPENQKPMKRIPMTMVCSRAAFTENQAAAARYLKWSTCANARRRPCA